MKILLVDDNNTERDKIKKVLSFSQFQLNVIDVSNINDAVKIFNTENFDIILINYLLAQTDGLKPIKLLSINRDGNPATVIILSNHDDERLSFDCLKAGAQDFLIKQEITPSKLRRTFLNAQRHYNLETELVKTKNNAKNLAERDLLTGLPNRNIFEQNLKLATHNKRHGENMFALILFDLDNFKYVNDTYGHEIGDCLLKKTCLRVSKCLRGSELFARIGGDEFAIILKGLKEETDAMYVTNRILETLSKPFDIKSYKFSISASIGIVIYPNNAESPEDLLKFADIAMYRSKHLGKNQACFFEQKMQDQFIENFKIANDLKTAIKSNQFNLHFQPVIDSNSSHIMGFEALLRWKIGKKNISPSTFIPIAEDSHQMIEIGRWVIKNAIINLSHFKTIYDKNLYMAINLSTVQLEDQYLASLIKKYCDEYHIQASQIELEITETALLILTPEKIKLINDLFDMGCSFALDDFGTGFSSIAHLRNFPLKTVKIDKSLMPKDPSLLKDKALLISLIDMIHSLELEVVGEGIETIEQFLICKKQNVKRIQGFYFYEALSAEDTVKLLESHKN